MEVFGTPPLDVPNTADIDLILTLNHCELVKWNSVRKETNTESAKTAACYDDLVVTDSGGDDITRGSLSPRLASCGSVSAKPKLKNVDEIVGEL